MKEALMAVHCECTCGKLYCASTRRRLHADLDMVGGRHGTIRRYNNGCRCDKCTTKHYRKQSEQKAKLAAATANGKRRGYRWTGVEMELAARKDLPIEEVAKQLGRTYSAVSDMRYRVNKEPKYRKAAGV